MDFSVDSTVEFRFADGTAERVKVPVDDIRAREAGATGRLPFAYPLPEKREGDRLGSFVRLLLSERPSQPAARLGQPRVLFGELFAGVDAQQNIAVTGDTIRVLAKLYDCVLYPDRLRSSRRISSLVKDLMRCEPDAIVLNGSVEDYNLLRAYGQPLIAIDEFEYRFEWLLDLLRNVYRLKVVLMLAPPQGETRDEEGKRVVSEAESRPYVAVLRQLAARYAVRVADLSPLYPLLRDGRYGHSVFAKEAAGIIARELNAAFATGEDAQTGAYGEPGSSQYRFPVSAVLRRGDSERALNPQEMCSFYLDLAADSAGGDDDRPAGSGKALTLLGGRKEFERYRQKQIVDFVTAREMPGRKRVLLIGDSIRLRYADGTGYGMHVYKRLTDRFNFTHIPHNCGGSSMVQSMVENWLSCKPDIVHLNCGLHDLVVPLESSERFAIHTPKQYAANLQSILDAIRASGAQHIIWALNTPVQEDWHKVKLRGQPRAITRYNRDIRTYNDVSLEVMRKNQIPVNDLFTPLWSEGAERVVLPDGVHLNHRGSSIAADHVVRHLCALG